MLPAPLSITVSWSCSNSCPLGWWCHLTISSSATLSSPPALHLSQHQESFAMIWLYTSGGQSIGSISPSTEYSGLISFRIDSFDLLVWISLEMSPVLHRVEDLVWVTDGGILRQVQLREGCPSGVPSVSLACWQVQIVPLAGAQLTV